MSTTVFDEEPVEIADNPLQREEITAITIGPNSTIFALTGKKNRFLSFDPAFFFFQQQ